MNTATANPHPFKRILYATDFAGGEDIAFQTAIDFVANVPEARLFLLHVIPEVDAQFWKSYLYEVEGIDDQAKKDIDAKIAAAYLSRVPSGVTVEVVYRLGKDYEEIIDCIHDKQIDLVVIGREGSGLLHNAFFGHVAEKVVRKAACAILVIPQSVMKKTVPAAPVKNP